MKLGRFWRRARLWWIQRRIARLHRAIERNLARSPAKFFVDDPNYRALGLKHEQEMAALRHLLP